MLRLLSRPSLSRIARCPSLAYLVVREELQTRANKRTAPRTTRNQSRNKSESNRRHTSAANDFPDFRCKINSQGIAILLPKTLQFLRCVFAPLVSQLNELGILHGQLFIATSPLCVAKRFSHPARHRTDSCLEPLIFHRPPRDPIRRAAHSRRIRDGIRVLARSEQVPCAVSSPIDSV